MLRYVIKRLLLMIPTLLGAALLVFLLMRLIPGDVCVLRLATGGGSMDATVIKNCRIELGLDQPYLVQFLVFLKGLGKLFVESISNHDYNMTQALVMLVVAIFALTNLVVDIIYAWLDPRIRYA